jgi:hypothetical protein
MKDFHCFDRNTPGYDEAWTGLLKEMQTLIGGNNGKRAAYQALKQHCREDNQAIPSDTAKSLMQIVLDGIPANTDLLIMESKTLPGEVWQYLGTFLKDGKWIHELRHRHLDMIGNRLIIHIACNTPVPQPETPKLVLANGFVDDGQPF